MNILAQKSSITPTQSDIKSPYGFIRGGRLRKNSKGLISFAPFLTGASVLALGALMATTTPVEAGMCTETGTTGMWTCTGAAGSDDPASITGRANQNIEVTGDTGFGLNVSSGEALDINSVATTGTIDVDLTNNNNITSVINSINIQQAGTGTVTLTTNGTLTSTGNYSSVVVNQKGAGGIDLTMDGAVIGGAQGISMSTVAATTGEINVTAKDITGNNEAISIGHKGNSAVTFTSTGTVTSNNEEAILVNHSGTGDVNITTGGTVTTGAADKDAIRVSQSGAGSVFITVTGRIVGGSSASAISISTASASDNATIILGTDANLEGNVDTSGVMGTTDIVLTGDGDADFSLDDDLRKFTDFNALEKTGSGTWRLTNRQGNAKTFDRIDVSEGKLVSEGITQLIGTNLNIAEGAIFEVEQQATGLFRTAVTLSGTIQLSGADTTLEVHDAISNSGGNVVIPVDFSDAGFQDGEHEFGNARFSAVSVDGDPIVINIRAMGELPGGIEEPVRIGNLVDVETANPNAFAAGAVLGGRMRLGLEITDQGEWIALVTKTAAAAGSIEEALYESLPAALTQLAGLESRQQRLRGRQHAINQAMWARIAGASGEFEPISTTQATYETGNAVAEFGIETPIPTNDSPFTLGVGAAFGDATTDVSVPGSVGEIASESIIGTLNASWELKGIYVDGQLRYTGFDNSIEKDAKIADVDVKAYAAGVEVGYAMELDKLIGRTLRPDAILIPSAQISWTSVDFDDFTDTDGMNVALEDGDVLLARAGVAFEDIWEGIALRGHADVLVPLDGEVATKLDGTETISEREDPAFDIGIGATYAWGGVYALSADISTQQGGDVAGYTASLGFVYSFF